MSDAFLQFLKLYTFKDNTYDYFSSFSNENKDFVEITQTNLDALTKDVHQSFQSCCMSMLKLCGNHHSDDILISGKKDLLKKLSFEVAHDIETKVTIYNKTDFDSYDLAKRSIDAVFKPLNDACLALNERLKM